MFKTLPYLFDRTALEAFQLILSQHKIPYKIVFFGAGRNAGAAGAAADQFAAHPLEQYQIKVKRRAYLLAEELYQKYVTKQ